MALDTIIRPAPMNNDVLTAARMSPPWAEWFRDLRTRTNDALVSGWVNVRDFGAVGDGVTDDLPAFEAAIDALPDPVGTQYFGGGVVFMPPGEYLLDGLLSLVVLRKAIWLLGCGPQSSRIVSTRDGVNEHAILAAVPFDVSHPTVFTENNRLSSFTLDRFDLNSTIPAPVAGNYGIYASGNAGILTLDHLEVRGFGDAGVRIEGPTGPVNFDDLKILYCANYGIQVGVDATNQPTQDVTIRGGAVQGCLGGVYAEDAASLQIEDCDIENDDSTLPAIRLTGDTLGALLANNSCRCSTLPSPAAVVSIDGGASGCVWVGGVTNADVDGVDNFQISGAATSRTSIIGGVHANHGAGSGYYARVTDATQNYFANPHLIAGQFAAGRDTVNNIGGLANKSIAIGVGMNNATAATATGGAATLPANPVGFKVDLLPDGTSVRIPYYSA